MSGTAAGRAAMLRRWPPPADLAFEWHADALLLPLAPDPGAPIPFRLGAYDREGRFLAHARALRANFASQDEPLRPAEEELAGDWIYAGVLWDHYGHFLLEALARAWALAAVPGVPLLWHRRVVHARLAPWQAEILDLLGLGGR